MKNIFFFTCMLLMQFGVSAQMKVGDNPTTINSASLLELETTNKGLVFPRVSLTNVALPAPLPAGLLTGTVVFNTNASIINGSGVGLYMWNGTAWNIVNTGISVAAWNLTGNSGLNASNNFAGTTDAVDYVLRTNKIERMRIIGASGVSAGWVGIGTAAPQGPLTITNNVAGDMVYIQNLSPTGYSTVNMLSSTGPIALAFGYANSGTPAYASGKNFLNTTNKDFFITTNSSANKYPFFLQNSTGYIGIGTSTPPSALSVLATNPLYLSGVQAITTFGTNDSVLTINAGVVKKAPTSALPSNGGSSNSWLITGNNNVNSSNFLGTTDPNVPLTFKVGNVQAGYLGIASSGITTLGVGAIAGSQQSTALGTGATATGQNSTALGAGATAGSQQSTALGTGATANDQASLAVGYNAKVTSQNAIAIGSNANTSVTGGVALGFGAIASSQNGVAIGSNAGATTNPNTLALGTGTKATGQNSIAVGNNASAPNIGSEAFGNSAIASGANSMVVGNNSTASGDGAISIGDVSTAAGTNSIVLGNNSSVAAVNNSIVLGTGSSVLLNANNTILIGDNLSTAQSNVLILGNSSKTVGISTTTPDPAAKLDVHGPFKLGANGTVIDNLIKITVTTSSDIIISQNATTTLTIPGPIVRIGATVIVNPRARNPRTRALPNTVAIGYAYVSARNTVTIDFITNDNGNATIPTGTKFDITIMQ